MTKKTECLKIGIYEKTWSYFCWNNESTGRQTDSIAEHEDVYPEDRHMTNKVIDRKTTDREASEQIDRQTNTNTQTDRQW